MSPIEKFLLWYQEETERTDVRIPSACCMATIGLDGYPNSRIVSLKEVKEGRFIITGPFDSRKGAEIRITPRAALTFWWPITGRQVRIQGDVRFTDDETADYYFANRCRESRILSHMSRQGRPLEDPEDFSGYIETAVQNFDDSHIARPDYWRAIAIDPVRIEFFEFNINRMHRRTLFIVNSSQWHMEYLQP